MESVDKLQPLKGYLGTRVPLQGTTAEIVDITVRGRSVCFVGREADSDQEFLVPLRYILENVIDDEAVVSAADS